MNFKKEILKELNIALSSLNEAEKIKELKDIIKIIEEKSLYQATIYDFLTIRKNTNYSLKEFYDIPEIRRAFLDCIKNPNLKSSKEDYGLDCIWLLKNRLEIEILINDKEFNEIFQNLTYEQAKRLLGGEETDKLLENKKYYDIILNKAKEDNRFYKLMHYNDFCLADNTYKKIALLDKDGNKLVNESPEIQIKVLQMLRTEKELNLSSFYFHFPKYDKTVQYYIIKTQEFREKLILANCENEYQTSFIPKEYESDIITLSIDFLKKLSYEKKYIFIYKLQDSEMQKYLITKIDFLKNLISYKNFHNFFKGIKDENFLVEIFCKPYILENIDPYNFDSMITPLSLESQRKIISNENFIKYFQTLSDYLKMSFICSCNEVLIEEYFNKNENISISDILKFFESTKNHNYLKIIIDKINTKEKMTEEEYYELQKIISSKIFSLNFLKVLTQEEFDFFLKKYEMPNDLESAIGLLDSSYIPTPLNEKDYEIFRNIEYDKELSPKEENVIGYYRDYYIAKLKYKRVINFLKINNNRIVKEFKYGVLEFFDESEKLIIFDSLSYDCLFLNIASCDDIANYCYNLFLENPHIFDNITIPKKIYTRYAGDNLSEESLKKLAIIYNNLNDNKKENILNEALFTIEDISNDVRNKIKNNPNTYSGSTYSKVLIHCLNDEELKIALLGLSLSNFLEYFSAWSLSSKKDSVNKEVILIRQDEILKELNQVTYKKYGGKISSKEIITRLLEASTDKEKLLKKLNPNLLLAQYNTFTTISSKETNNIIVKILMNNPSILINGENDKVKTLLSSLDKQDFDLLIQKLNINEVIELFIKTKNKDLEEKIMFEFNKTPYFINNTNITIEELLSRLEENNKIIISTTIDEEFNNLIVPFNIKNKLKKSSYDEKMFLIYGIKEQILNEEKLQYINELLRTDPFALNSLNIELFKNENFIISKNIIPSIYRYEDLTNLYINLLNNKNNKSKIMIILLEYYNKTNSNMSITIKKIDSTIKYLALFDDENIERYDLNNITEEEIVLLEEYILYQIKDYAIEGDSSFLIFKNNDITVAPTFKEIEYKRLVNFDEQLINTTDLSQIKNYILEKHFKLDLNQAEKILRRYQTSLNSVKKYLQNNKELEFILLLDKICKADSKSIKELYNLNIYYKLSDIIEIMHNLDKAYNKCISNTIKGYENGIKKNKEIIINNQPINLEVIEIESDFELLVHSTDAYGSMEMINDNYFDSWNYSDRTANHGICASFISNSNLGTARVRGKGVLFGFVNLNENSITTMAPYDIVSKNQDIQTTSRHPAMFTDTKDLASYTRHTHNELVLERRNIKEDAIYPVIQPDCIIIYDEMEEEIKSNALKAQQDFKSKGIYLPIIYINRRK